MGLRRTCKDAPENISDGVWWADLRRQSAVGGVILIEIRPEIPPTINPI